MGRPGSGRAGRGRAGSAGRRRRFGSLTGKTWLSRSLLALGVVAALLVLWMTWLVVVYPASRTGSGRVVAIDLSQPVSVKELSVRLQREGVIAHGWAFAWYARVLGAGSKLRRGTVLITDDMTPRQVLQRLSEGLGPVPVKITVPEGHTRYDVAALLSRWGFGAPDAFVKATEHPSLLKELGITGHTAEGYLFPDTYVLVDDMTPAAVIGRLVDNYRRRTDRVFDQHVQQLAALQQQLGWGRHQVLTLASIVEREAAKRDEMPIIAGVFLNRLRDPDFKPHRLQADPTVSYGCLTHPLVASCLGFDGRRITRTMTSGADNPYNTYRIEGLPPGPIANPGLAAITAVLKPAQHRYFYFVAKGGGRHTFSETLEAHNQAVAKTRQ